MTKVIIALHRPGLDDVLRGEPLRDGLAATGATALQVNVDDAPVAEALRFGPAAPVTALVSVWTAGSPGAVIDVVRRATGEDEVHAWSVAEHVRLDGARVADGTRADVLAQVALLRRPEAMAPEDYLDYWMVEHTPIAIRTQNTSAYVQNVVLERLTEATPVVSGIVEEHFPMEAISDSHAFYGSRGDRAERDRRIAELMASVARMGADQGLDLVPTSRYRWSLAGTGNAS
ncbi:hypothetical protein [Nocardioides sp. AE5]|uniref:hypothetical protein n=1 Tax=Nocardioides sp. AE5 TaxID=2962573 RepID=UPI0028821423|nr:hypothetical protein [Nocardioides sp. AE5]MDT0200848.1 hypothetical protein [Nocardioides sp. AE5]